MDRQQLPEQAGWADRPKGAESPFVFDRDLTDRIIGKYMRKYEGKYASPLFGINVAFSETEQAEILSLVQRSRAVSSHFVTQQPDNAHLQYWSKVIDAVEADLQCYRLGNAKGTSATYLGMNLKELKRFAVATYSLNPQG